MGVVGVSLGDFMVMTPAEADSVFQAWREAEETRVRGAWERSRLMAYSSVSPYLGKKGPKSPQKFLPLPWDAESGRNNRKSRNSQDASCHQANLKAIALLKKLNGG